MRIRELREKQAQLVAEARERLDEIKDDTPEARRAELEAAHDAAMAKWDELEARAKRELALEERQRQLETGDPERRPNGEDRGEKPGKVDERQGFIRLLAGQDGRTAEERAWMAAPERRAAMGVGSGSIGGYTVPSGFLAEIDKAMAAYGPMLDPGVTRQITTDTGNALPWPTMDDTGNVGRLLTENSQVTDTDITFGQKQLNAYTYSSDLVLVSLQLLQDSAFNVEDEVINPAFGERLGRIVNTHLTTGDASSKPSGIVTGSTLGKTAASSSAITADELIDFYHSIDPAYRASPNFKFMFHDSTLKAIRKLKDSYGRYLIDGLKDNGATINLAGMSVAYVVNQAMATIATGNKVVVGGDFSKYIVRRVKEKTVLALRERYADYLQVGFVAFGRFDGILSNTAAVKHYIMA